MNPDHTLILPGIMAAIVVLVTVAALLLLREASRRELEIRIQTVIGGATGRTDSALSQRLASVVSLLRTIGQNIRTRTHLYSEDDLAALEGMLVAGGFNPKRFLSVVLGAKIVLLFLVPALAITYGIVAGLSPGARVIALVVSLPIGLLGPEWLLRAMRRPYVRALRRGVADALDLLVVCTEAGMGLESAIEQVAREMRGSNRAMSAALTTLLDELKVLPDRRTALINFGKRSGVEGLRKTSAILAQTLQYGTPLGQALRAVANELRRDRAVRFEEKAVRLPALLVFPLILFILPSLFIVMGASSIMRLSELLSTFHTGG